MSMSTDDGKQSKREAKALWEQARRTFAAGDYRATRALDQRVQSLAGDHELGQQAARELEQLNIDPVGLYVGVGALALYLVAWVYALW